MKKILKIFILTILFLVIVVSLIPDKTIKVTTKELAQKAEINPLLAGFIVKTKVGREVAYFLMKKEMKKFFSEEKKEGQ